MSPAKKGVALEGTILAPDVPSMETLDHPPQGNTDPSVMVRKLLDPPERPGDLGCFGDYQVVRILGIGGMGVVLHAQERVLQRQVALKLMRPDTAALPEARIRFLREARAAAAVEHPRVVIIYRVGDVNGVPFLAMPLMKGESLAHRLHREPRPPLTTSLRICREVAEGLAAAHAKNLVHRDIKPDNIWLEETPEGTHVRLLDFGLARGFEAERLTRQGVLVGSPGYMAPEQAAGRVDFRADLFSLGCVLYELTTARQAFRGSNLLEILAALASHQPEPPHQVNLEVPASLSRFIMQLLEKVPDHRPPSADAVVTALRQAEVDLKNLLSSPTHVALPGAAPQNPRPLENVQFTVFRPKTVRPNDWYPLLAFTHLAVAQPRSVDAGLDLIVEVRKRAQQILGTQSAEFRDTSTDAATALPRESELVFVPEVPGVEFNPPRRAFRWSEDIHVEAFRFRAAAHLDGQTARGRITVYLGTIVLADIVLAIPVNAAEGLHAATAKPTESETAVPYRKIFASYSDQDGEIVRQYALFVETLGDKYLRAVQECRAGETLNSTTRRLIKDADVFQLFWSRHSMVSPTVRQEWEYALALNRPYFVRPTYWEEPLPELPHHGLPPEELRRLHFHRLTLPAEARPAPAAPAYSTGRVAAPELPRYEMSADHLEDNKPPILARVVIPSPIAPEEMELSLRDTPSAPALEDHDPKPAAAALNWPRATPRDIRATKAPSEHYSIAPSEENNASWKAKDTASKIIRVRKSRVETHWSQAPRENRSWKWLLLLLLATAICFLAAYWFLT